MARKHNEEEVLFQLKKKHDVKVVGKDVFILNGKSKRSQKTDDLGNGSWGKIDFLCNHKGYIKRFVSDF